MSIRRTIVLLVVVALALAACTGNSTTSPSTPAEQVNREIAESNIDALITAEPPASVSHPMTRQTINFWLETWDVPDKPSYIYIVSDTGAILGYFVGIGLPVSYCVGLEEPYEKIRLDLGEFGGDTVVPKRSQDGVYYGGCDARTRYFRTADTGAFVEVSGLNTFVTDQPIDIEVAELRLTGS